jgi:flagellar biosynthesis repressor protein FlbT
MVHPFFRRERIVNEILRSSLKLSGSGKPNAMPLKLSLKPGETFVVNGAVVRNGDRRSALLLETQARVLREKDILLPARATSPAGRAYFAIMQMYLLGEIDGPAHAQAADAIGELLISLPDGAARAGVLSLSAEVASGELYRALTRCRKLLAPEPCAAAVTH